MTEFSRRTLLTGAAGLAVAGVGSSLLSGRASATTAASTPIHIPATSLRGYGTLHADFAPFGNASSLLQIQCQSTQQARLTHAKYLSDLTLLPGISPVAVTVAGLRISAYQTSAGIVAALTAGDTVATLAAKDKKSFTALARHAIPRGTTAADFVSQATVPMFLDRYDKYGMLLYFGPFVLPPGWDRSKPYDFNTDFQFVKDNGLGVVLWDSESELDYAEGLSRMPYWEWVAAECESRDIPVGINTQWAPGMWLSNRYRDQMMQKMPQYSGNYMVAATYSNSVGVPSYSATTGLDTELGVLQATVRRHAPSSNIVGWLEPHSEMQAGPATLLVEYGAVPDTTFRVFLQDRYTTLSALGQAWYGDPASVRSWDKVRIPELATFFGWGPDALDVAGTWRVLHPGTAGAPTGWDQPGFDDSDWGTVTMPGSDRDMFTPKTMLNARRSLDVDAGWLAAHPRVWLYVFDLNTVTTTPLPATVNGHQTPGLPPTFNPHWGAVEVTGLLQAGSNLIAVALPNGYIGYRCYLSGDEPAQYPSLGAQRNAQWMDFQDWSRWARQNAVRRGAEMIRQEDPDRPINFMAPGGFVDLEKQVCARYGGNFHDTGAAAAFWADSLPLLSRSSGRPATAEPSQAPATAEQVQSCWGRWITEGFNGIHYFPDQTVLMDNPAVLTTFQNNRALYQSIGKYHAPMAEVGVLYGTRMNGHGSWPWIPDPNTWLPGGYFARNTGHALLPVCPHDGVTELDFGDGTVDQYQVIIDTNTSIMDDTLVDQVEAWIRNGGTFVTYVQTGRHTSTEANSWPISRLTGYDVTAIDTYTRSLGEPGQEHYIPGAAHGLTAAPGQRVFTDATWLSTAQGSGLSLKKKASDAQDLLLWDDGTVAAGMRTLGKGRIIHLGCHFEEILDRDPAPITTAFLSQITDYLDVARVPASAADVVFRHFISNTGLHDIWILYNDTAATVSTDLLFTTAPAPTALSELTTTTTTPVTTTNGTPGIYGLTLQPWDMRIFLSPRATVPQSPLEWLTTQRNWWAGTTAPDPTPLPTPTQDQQNTIDLTDDWTFLPVDNLTDAQILALTAPNIDDSTWEHRNLGIWTMPDHPDVLHGVLRKTITIPTDWATGATQLWLNIDNPLTQVMHDQGRVYLDGTLIQDFPGGGFTGLPANTLLPPGKHLIALEIQGTGPAVGIAANAWAYHIPEPQSRQDLTGTWTLTDADLIHNTGQTTIPGTFTAAYAARDITIDTTHADSNVIIYLERPNASINGILINGSFIGDLYPAPRIGNTLLINITNKVHFGDTNHIELATANATIPTTIPTIELRYYNPTTYP